MDSIPYQYEGGAKAVYVKLGELERKLRNEINAKRRELTAVSKKRKAAYDAFTKEK